MSISGYYSGAYNYPAPGYQYYQSQPQPHPNNPPQHQPYHEPTRRADQGDHNPATSLYFKTKLCVKWKENNCRYGARCKYAHGEHELRQLPPTAAELQHGIQPSPSQSPSVMLPANATEEQRAVLREALRKTKMCERQLRTADCPWGDRCNFAHTPEELKSVPPNLQDMINAAGQRSVLQSVSRRNRGHRNQPDVTPPASELLPTAGSMGVTELQQRFEQLKKEANRYAAQTGHSVAIFSVGAVLDGSLEETRIEGTEVPGEVYVKAVPANSKGVSLKCTVLKYGTGGASKQLSTRQEVVQFVAQQAVKTIAAAAVVSDGVADGNGAAPAGDVADGQL